jgi:Flp pilus assembly protein TadD
VSSAAAQQAIALLQAGATQKALEIATRVLATEPHDIDALLVVAAARRRLGDIPGSMSAIESALHLAPESAQVSNQLAFTRHLAGDVPGALEAANRTIRLEPDQVWPRASMAAILSETRGQAREAVRAAEDALRMDPENVYVLGILGQSQLLLRHRAEAEASFRRALALDPEDWLARHGLARLENLVGGDPIESIRRFSRLLPERPDDETIPVNLRVALLRLLRRLSWIVIFAPAGAAAVFGFFTRSTRGADGSPPATFLVPSLTPFPSITIDPLPSFTIPALTGGPVPAAHLAPLVTPTGGGATAILPGYLPAALGFGVTVWILVAVLVVVTLIRLRPFSRSTVRFAWRERPLRWLALAMLAVLLPLPVPYAFPLGFVLALVLGFARLAATATIVRRNQAVVN